MPNTLTVRGGIGDMLKSIYDTDGSGKVDDSQKLQESTKTQVQDHTPKSHTHTEAHITNLDHDAQKVKGVIINDAGKADQKVLAFDSGTDRIVYIEPAPAGAVLESIQTLQTTASDYYAINEVVMLKTVLFFSSRVASDLATRSPLGYIYLSSSTQIFSYNWLNSISEITVVEFASGIKDVQRGQLTIGGANLIADITITEVDLAKAIILYGGTQCDAGTHSQLNISAHFLDSTHIRGQREGGGSTAFLRYEVLEFE